MSRLSWGLLLLATATSVAQETNKVPEKIVGGWEASPGQYPYQVSLWDRGGWRPWCGGTILGKRTILTAAHCVHEEEAEYLAIAAGDHNYSEEDGEKKVNVCSYKIHENYQETSTPLNDIAILELCEDLQFSDRVRPIKLPSGRQTFQPGARLIVSGWGTVVEGGFSMSKVLKAVAVEYVSNEECGRTYSVRNTHLCAGTKEGGKDSCQGDSGGPLISEAVELVGIVSSGKGCARPGVPGVYTRVDQYLDWIRRNAKDTIITATPPHQQPGHSPPSTGSSPPIAQQPGQSGSSGHQPGGHGSSGSTYSPGGHGSGGTTYYPGGQSSSTGTTFYPGSSSDTTTYYPSSSFSPSGSSGWSSSGTTYFPSGQTTYFPSSGSSTFYPSSSSSGFGTTTYYPSGSSTWYPGKQISSTEPLAHYHVSFGWPYIYRHYPMPVAVHKKFQYFE